MEERSVSNHPSFQYHLDTHNMSSVDAPFTLPSPSPSPQPAPLPATKKKRNPPGNPDPEAEVVALSPRSLTATNRFVCEVCSKGFQREQNLQLHRRGHNLPWKLRQRAPGKEARKRVYVCPEPGCVHHDPARALGDMTGIKKHFSRKHGEKTWRCERCSKRYAVRSDWKAHSKTCGTREYPCDCGAVFSRKDSFITHRAFCDALTQESSAGLPAFSTSSAHMSATALLQKAAQMGASVSGPSSSLFGGLTTEKRETETFAGRSSSISTRVSWGCSLSLDTWGALD